jgi:hypothetical protein
MFRSALSRVFRLFTTFSKVLLFIANLPQKPHFQPKNNDSTPHYLTHLNIPVNLGNLSHNRLSIPISLRPPAQNKKTHGQKLPFTSLAAPPLRQSTRPNSNFHNTLHKLSYSLIAKPPTLRYKYVLPFLAVWAEYCEKKF